MSGGGSCLSAGQISFNSETHLNDLLQEEEVPVKVKVMCCGFLTSWIHWPVCAMLQLWYRRRSWLRFHRLHEGARRSGPRPCWPATQIHTEEPDSRWADGAPSNQWDLLAQHTGLMFTSWLMIDLFCPWVQLQWTPAGLDAQSRSSLTGSQTLERHSASCQFTKQNTEILTTNTIQTDKLWNDYVAAQPDEKHKNQEDTKK